MRSVRVLFVAMVVVCAVFVPRIAAADKPVGILVTGQYLRGPTQAQAQKWLHSQGKRVVTTAMPSDAVKTLLDCFVLDDPKCTRGVVEARATTETLITIRVDVASKKQREIRLTVDWFVKGHSPVSARRTCDRCTEAVLRSTIDTLLADLAKTAPGFMGMLEVTSDPPGITVLLDNATIGVTPLERNVPVGEHTVQLVRDGRTGEARSVTVAAGAPTKLALEAPLAATPIGTVPEGGSQGRRSRLVPGLLIGVGVAAIGTGIALYLLDEDPTGQGRTYRDTEKLGIGVAAGGGALLLTGAIILVVTKSSSTPTVSMMPGGATVGWAGRF